MEVGVLGAGRQIYGRLLIRGLPRMSLGRQLGRGEADYPRATPTISKSRPTLSLRVFPLWLREARL